MRIALISSSFLPRVGGMEWKVHHLATEYTRHGHDVTVFACRPWITLKPIPLPMAAAYRVVRCGFPIRGFDRLGLSTLCFRRGILAEHRRRPFDVLHCHHLGLPTHFGARVKAATGVPVVATTCGGDVLVLPEIGYGDRLQRRFDRMVRRNVRCVDVVGSVSSAIREELERIGTTARIVDIPNGVPWDAFQTGPSTVLRTRLGLGNGAIIVLSAGSNQVVKGYDLGIRAFGRLAGRFPSAAYVLVGRGIPRLEPLVSELGLRGRVHLLEQVPQSDLPAMFHSADIFLSPSLMEGFSQVNAQALACGLPCVFSDAPGNPDAAAHGGALLARTGDVDSMADALSRLIGDPSLRRRLAGEAFEAGKRYAWTRIAEDYLSVFESLIRDRGSDRRAACVFAAGGLNSEGRCNP